VGTLISTVIGVSVALVVVSGLWAGLNLALSRTSQQWDDRLRPLVFVGPAILFLGVALVIPAIRTIVLSFQGGSRGDQGWTLGNWTTALQSRNILDVSWERFGNIFTSQLFVAGVVLAGLAIAVAALASGRAPASAADQGERAPRRGGLDFTSPGAVLLMGAGVIAVLMAVFSALRGAVINNLWWVVVVAGFSTVFGLALAVLADRSRGENLAKSLIFMPMAISLVGAAVIWKYVYDTPGAGQAEGLLNVIWPGGPIDFIRGSAPGGTTIMPWNNLFIMAIMIWIQTGFAMVVLSAAVKGVPAELHEAARVDGANEAQVFWRVTLPQITSTIIVVVTTLTITVLKIFDLVKATTNGQGGTDVLANVMYEGLRVGNFTQASTFATMILVLVLPVMYLNVRRTSREVRV
jgi:ABC-type sugar transport system permease subunit